jgi:hypothetical protein
MLYVVDDTLELVHVNVERVCPERMAATPIGTAGMVHARAETTDD